MSLYVGDVDVAIPIVLTTPQAADVARLVISYTPNGVLVEWDLTPTSSTATTVSFTRVLVAGDLPKSSPTGYTMRATAYDSDGETLFKTDKFQGPRVEP